MKLNRFFIGLFCATALLTACSDDDDYQWAPMTGGNQVYFSNTLPSTINLSRSESSFNIPVSRVDSVAAGSYSVALQTESKFITAPANVTFNAGQRVANLTLNYLTDSLKYDDFQKATITITDEANVNEYGAKSYTFNFGIPSPYVSLGKGTFTDNYWFEESTTVTIMQNSENKSVFRIMSPFEGLASAANTSLDGNQDSYIEITILKPGDTTYGVEITQNDLVSYSDICTGYFHSSYEADIYMLYPGRFTSMADEGSFLHNRVIEWQANGMPGRIQLAPYFYMFGVGGWNKTQEDGMVIIDFPGYDPKDFSIEMENLGVLTDLSGSAYAAIVATLGEDASDVRAVVVSADDDADEVGAALATAGEGEYTAISDGNNFIPIPEGLTGKLNIVVAVVDDGETKEVFITEFEYWGGGVNPWETVGKGDYVYTLYFGSLDDPTVDPGLEMQ